MSNKDLILQFVELLRKEKVLAESGEELRSAISAVEELLERHNCMIDTQCREQLLILYKFITNV